MAVSDKLSPTTTSRVSRETVSRAVDSLLNWMKAQAKHKKAQLLEDDDLIHLLLAVKKIPHKGRTKPYLIPLPHPLHSLDDPSIAICLFIDDRPSAAVTPESVQDKIKAESIPVSEVITLSGLRCDYRPYEARRRLCGSYDLFFADRSILPLLPRLLGKHFFKKKKQPIAVDLSHKNWKEQLRHCCSSATLYLRTGTCSHLNVGRSAQGRDEIVNNVLAAVEGAVERIPKKWSNLRALHLKSPESLALPIYQALPDIGFKIEGFAKKKKEIVVPEDGPANGEVVQSLEEEPKKVVSKKGRIHEVRYMDNNLDEGDVLVSELSGDDGAIHGDGELEEGDERDGEKKGRKREGKVKAKTKAKKKDKVSLASNENATFVDGSSKRKGKTTKSDVIEAKAKKIKKNKIRHETD